MGAVVESRDWFVCVWVIRVWEIIRGVWLGNYKCSNDVSYTNRVWPSLVYSQLEPNQLHQDAVPKIF